MQIIWLDVNKHLVDAKYVQFVHVIIDIGPIKVNQKMAFLGFETWKPGKWNIKLGIWNWKLKNLSKSLRQNLSQRAEKKVQNIGLTAEPCSSR